jgi:hypothetical protein
LNIYFEQQYHNFVLGQKISLKKNVIELHESEVLVAMVDVQGIVDVGYDVEELFNDILV